jgi:arylsulfatase A-like enzyme
VPLMMRVPQRYLGTASSGVVHQQVANIDLAPTMLELAGGQPCTAEGDCRVMDGRSLMPLLRGGAGWPSGRGVLIEYDGASSKGTSSCKYSAIRTPGRIYVDHVSAPDPVTGICQPTEETELYDLSTDPFELQNLAPSDDPSTKALQQRLDRLETCAGLPGRDPQPPPDSSYCE